jgi:hypothetical protein
MTPGVPTLVDSIPTDENCEMLTGSMPDLMGIAVQLSLKTPHL